MVGSAASAIICRRSDGNDRRRRANATFQIKRHKKMMAKKIQDGGRE